MPKYSKDRAGVINLEDNKYQYREDNEYYINGTPNKRHMTGKNGAAGDDSLRSRESARKNDQRILSTCTTCLSLPG